RLPARPDDARHPLRRRHRVPDPDRVPPARRAGQPPGRGAAAQGAGRGRLAGGRDRARQHARRLPRPPPAQVAVHPGITTYRNDPTCRILIEVARIGLGGLRGRLSLAVVGLVALALAAMAAIFNVVLDNRLSADANSVLRSRATDELAALTTVDGKLHVRERPDDAALETRLWVYAGSAKLEGPARSPAEVERAVKGLVGRSRKRVELTGPDLRLLAVPVVIRGARLGTVIAAVSLKPYEQTRRTALIASLI